MFCIKRDFVSPTFDDLLLQILRSKLNTKVIVSKNREKKMVSHCVKSTLNFSLIGASS